MINLSSRAAAARASEEGQKAISKLEKSGGGGHGDGMEARVAKLEALAESTDRRLATIEQDIRGVRSDQRQDFRLLFAAIIATALGLAALMARGFHWL